MFYQRASKYSVILGLLLLLLGTDRMVLAQRRAKTKPTAPIRKTEEKPQGVKAELEDFAQKYIKLYFTKCEGDSFYSYANVTQAKYFTLLETKNLQIRVEPKDISKADSLNGIEGRGSMYIYSEAFREYDFSNNMWREWEDGRMTNESFFRPGGNRHIIAWTLEKRDGVWAINPSLPGHDSLTNTEFMVRCDNITAGSLPERKKPK